MEHKLRTIPIFVATAFVFVILGPAQTVRAASVRILTPRIRLGQTLIVKFDEAPKNIVFDGQEITAFPYQNSWRAAAPIPLSDKTGAHPLAIEWSSGQKTIRSITVLKNIAKTIVLPPPPKLGLTAPQIVENLDVSNSSLRAETQIISSSTYFQKSFGLPLWDNRKISSHFGEIRKTGGEAITHLGVDFEAKKGAAVAAINAGIVKESYLDPIYGNTIVIDHGRGIYSLYMHLSSLKVAAGDTVKKGATIGTVGDTGLASAPHLHLSIKINGISVDPIQFVSIFR